MVKIKSVDMEISIGNLIDQLSVTNMKIWAAEDIKRDPKATNKMVADATRITNIANQQRNCIIEAIDIAMNKIAKGELQKLYGQGSTKLYGKK